MLVCVCVCVCVGLLLRSSFWRGRPPRELTRYEPLDVLSRPFEGFFSVFFWAGACARVSVVARSCVCVSGVGQRTRHTAVPAPTKVGGACCWLFSARALSRSPTKVGGGLLLAFQRAHRRAASAVFSRVGRVGFLFFWLTSVVSRLD